MSEREHMVGRLRQQRPESSLAGGARFFCRAPLPPPTPSPAHLMMGLQKLQYCWYLQPRAPRPAPLPQPTPSPAHLMMGLKRLWYCSSSMPCRGGWQNRDSIWVTGPDKIPGSMDKETCPFNRQQKTSGCAEVDRAVLPQPGEAAGWEESGTHHPAPQPNLEDWDVECVASALQQGFRD